MNEKYSTRDFIVYILTGVFLLFTLLYKFDLSLLNYFKINKSDIERNPTVTILLLIPGLYLVGQTIHGLDLIIFKLGRYVSDYQKKIKYTQPTRHLWLFIVGKINFLINGNRISGITDKQRDNSSFWKNYNIIKDQSALSKSEYWLLINDLQKGITLISFCWTMFYLYNKDYLNLCIFFLLFLIFWYRSRHSATNFVKTVNYLTEKQ